MVLRTASSGGAGGLSVGGRGEHGLSGNAVRARASFEAPSKSAEAMRCAPLLQWNAGAVSVRSDDA